ncbi:MAG: hypothetical protein ACRDJU_10020 [Actinomycetota bacterium]
MADKTCAHENCNCTISENDTYCSEYCERHGSHEGHVGHECGCGHPGCH